MRGLCVVLVLVLTSVVTAQPLPLKLPAAPVRPKVSDIRDPRVAVLQGQIDRGRIFAAYRELSSIYEKNGLFAESAALHREQAGLYRAKGFEDAAIIEEMRAAEVDNDLRLFVDTAVPATATGKLFTGAPLEPTLGCYSGAFIDQDHTLGEPFVADGQIHRSPDQFQATMGRRTSNLFIYWSYGRPFPSDWVRKLKEQNCIPNIAWEPRDMRQVKDDAYLRKFAADLAAADWPVFIRFASEMNGFWTPYHYDAKLYREKFRLVHRVLHANNAARVALIWCVGNPPLTGIDRFYPGDDAVDWVGVNFYSVPFHNSDRKRPAFTENPLSLLDPIYKKYAAKKPIAICEYAASHMSVVDRKPIAGFAKEKLSLVYGALPLLYPRVKLIDWFDMNTIPHAMPGKTLNNYLLAENALVRQAWAAENSLAWFLQGPEKLADPLPPVAQPLEGKQLAPGSTIRVWAKCHSALSRCWLELDGKLVAGQRKTGAWQFRLPEMAAGSHTLRALMYDDQGRFMAWQSARFVATKG